MVQIFRTPEEFRSWRKSLGQKSVGFVPTMGALHEGHASLLRRARSENDICVLSIFVNPTQFNDKTDFEKYPITWDADLEIAKQNKVDAIFAPLAPLMYPDDYLYKLTEQNFSRVLCGKDRPGHFDGVLTVVMKLFQIIQPQKAYFGEKDFQQLTLIQGMTKAFFLPLEIVPVPTLREKDGLAMSSRNVRLTPEQRTKAPLIYQFLKESKSANEVTEKLQAQGWKVDYVVDLENRRFVAVHVGGVRLIDNVEL
jgi:pantoate--beta-alanine ligase